MVIGPRSEKNLEEQLITDGVLTTLRRDWRYTRNLQEIEMGLEIIDRFERESGRRVAILGQQFVSVTSYEHPYRVYTAERATELEHTGRYSLAITRAYLEKRKERLLSPQPEAASA